MLYSYLVHALRDTFAIARHPLRRPTPKMNGKMNGNAEEEESEEEEEPEPVSATLVCFRPSTVQYVFDGLVVYL